MERNGRHSQWVTQRGPRPAAGGARRAGRHTLKAEPSPLLMSSVFLKNVHVKHLNMYVSSVHKD